MKRITVVCWGNIFRSPVASILINNKISEMGLSTEIECVSRGIQGFHGIPRPKFETFIEYEDEYRLAQPILEKYSIDIGEHYTQPIDRQSIDGSDLIICMDQKVANDPEGGILSHFSYAKDKLIIFRDGIIDPAESTSKNKYEKIIQDIIDVVESDIPNILINLTETESNQEIRMNHNKQLRK